MALPIARRIPFEKSLVGNQYPDARADDRIQTEKCLIRETHERKESLSEVSISRAP